MYRLRKWREFRNEFVGEESFMRRILPFKKGENRESYGKWDDIKKGIGNYRRIYNLWYIERINETDINIKRK